MQRVSIIYLIAKMETKLLYIWGLSIFLIVVALSSGFAESVDMQQEQSEKNDSKLFDFLSFKKVFKKSYGSVVEELAREKLFLARAFRAFISKIKYRQKELTYCLGINDKSDWTRKELKSLASREPLRMLKEGLFTNKDKKFEKQGLNKNLDEGYWKSIVSGTKNYLHSLASIVLDRYLYSPKKAEAEVEPEAKEKNSDVLYIDHRKKNCFVEAKNQGKCSSCYIFSTMSAYEYQYCVETGNKISFAEQYPLDCARERSGTLGCEAGSEIRIGWFVEKFGLILEKSYPYREKEESCPYSTDEDNQKMGFFRVSRHGMAVVQYNEIEEYLEQAPILIPVLTSENLAEYSTGVYTSNSLGFEDSDKYFGHTMLLVGMGKQNGLDYWLLRNSYGVSYGENGYLKLSKDRDNWVYNDTAFSIRLQQNEKLFLEPNQQYDSKPIEKRYQAYVKLESKLPATESQSEERPTMDPYFNGWF